jgi:oxygen-independent coproporphyrinogen III oxidase
MLGLYVHVPFCSAICNYCNFNRGLFDADLKERYVGAILSEISGQLSSTGAGASAFAPESGSSYGGQATSLGRRSAQREGGSARHGRRRLPADTIYFGGGTPSLLESEEVARIIKACEEHFDVAPDREITLEANPETVTTARLEGYRRAGVNRLSFGVQSFRDDELRRLSRLHGAERARAALREARAAGFDNVSLDLMMWLPGQKVDAWLESVDEAAALQPEHLSLYLLEVYPNAPLRDEMARAQWSQAPDEDAETMYVTAMERLEAAGYEQYEISNVARPGRRSRHNLKYWTDGEWLGFGCGAHSTRDGVRWKNMSSTEEYIDRVTQGVPPGIDARRMTDAERLGDALFMGLRLHDGVDERVIERRYGVDVWRRYGPDLQPYVEGGLLMRQDRRMRLTRRGMLLAHEVMAVFV